MAIHPVLSIRYLSADPKITTKRDKVVETEVELEDETGFFNRVFDFAAKTAWRFANFMAKISGLEYDKKLDKKISKRVEKQSWIIEEDIESRPDKKALQSELLLVAKSLVSDHRQRLLERSYPPKPASFPGEYPKYRTGNLAKSIVHKWRDKKNMIIDVGYKDINGLSGNPAVYSQILAAWDRKSLPDTARGIDLRTPNMGLEIVWKHDGSSN